jgi:hypothetical protein
MSSIIYFVERRKIQLVLLRSFFGDLEMYT